MTEDDKQLESDEIFIGKDVVVTIKMDGENSTVYKSGFLHARSIDGNKNPWQDWLKRYVRQWSYMIPDGWRVCGENLYPRHSIEYTFPDEKHYFQAFGVYDSQNVCKAWKDVKWLAEQLGIMTVPEIYAGKYDSKKIFEAFVRYSDQQMVNGQEVEGFVVRTAGDFKYEDFCVNVGKYVRAHHVQTDEHWTRNWKPNELQN